MPRRPAARLVPVAGLALAAGFAAPATTAPVPAHLMPKDPPLAYPTRVGTTWVYDHSGADRTVVVSRVEDRDGAKLVTTEFVGGDGRRTPHAVVAVSADGVFLVAERGTALAEPRCLLKLPYREGQTWRSAWGGLVEARTAGPWEKVKVPAGEFVAVRVRSKHAHDLIGDDGSATSWYAHGVGLVRYADGGGQIRLENDLVLKSFTPGKD